MSHPGDRVRSKLVMWLGGAAALSAILGGVSLVPANPTPAHAETGAFVAPGFADHRKDVALVMVTTSEGSYHLARDPGGDGGVWVMPEKGRYLIRPELIAQIEDALSSMRFGATMTKDKRKLDRIGLGDPATGGAGALVEIGDGHGSTFAKLIIGRRDGKTYVRKPGEDQAWATSAGDPPPLHRAARWLDLDVVHVAAADIAMVSVSPAGAQAYQLRPLDEAGSHFGLAPPLDKLKLVAGFAPNPPALALTRLAPEDVAPIASLKNALPITDYRVGLKSGLAFHVTVLHTPTGNWAKIEAGFVPEASSGAMTEGLAINARTLPWAFKLSEADASNLTTPLSAIADVK